MTATGPGFLLGALLAGRVTRRFGVGPSLVATALLFGVTRLALPPAAGPLAVVAPILAAVNLASGVGAQINAIGQISLRQAIVPDRLLGRVNASMRFIAWSTAPLGGLLGGLLGEAIGLRPTLGVAAILAFLAPLGVWFSPLRTLRELPERGAQATAPAS